MSLEKIDQFHSLIREDFNNNPFGQNFSGLQRRKEDDQIFDIEDIDKALIAMEKGEKQVYIQCSPDI